MGDYLRMGKDKGGKNIRLKTLGLAQPYKEIYYDLKMKQSYSKIKRMNNDHDYRFFIVLLS
jgi:hypothetical protein